GTDRVVAGGAVGAEELATAGDVLLACLRRIGVLLRRDRRTRAEAGHVRRERGNLLIGVGRRAFLGLRPGRGQWHPAGPALEVDGRRADADQRRPVVPALLGLDALAVLAVAAGTADQIQLPASFDLARIGGIRIGRLGRER